MPALLAALTRALQVRRRWTVAAITGAAAIASAAMAVWIVGMHDVPDPCAAPTDRLAPIWNPARRARLAATVVAADPTRGVDRASKIGAALDAAGTSWSAMYVEACRATRVDGRQSDTLLDRRMACLGRWLAELGDTVRVVEQARAPAAVDHAVLAATGMSPLAACADAAALSEALPPPGDVALRTAAESLARRARELDVEQRAGRLDGLAARVRELVADARRLGYPPSLVAALTVAARVDFAVGDERDAESLLRELAQAAASARDDATAAFAWTNLVLTLGRNQGKPDAAIALVPTAHAAVLRAGDPPGLRADLLRDQAAILNYGAHPEQGLTLLIEARKVLETAGAVGPGSSLAARFADVLLELGSAYSYLGDRDAAIAVYHQAIDQWRALYGADSPDEAFAWQNIGGTLQRAGKLDDALAAFTAALHIRESRLGDSPLTASSHVAVGTVLHDQRHWDQALEHYDRAIQIDRAQLAPDDLRLLQVVVTRATLLTHLHRLDEAARAYDDAIAVYEQSGAKVLDAATALYYRGKLAAARGHCDLALPDQARAIALLEELRGPRSERLVYPLVDQAWCMIETGRPSEAIAPLERAGSLPDKTTSAYQLALARAYLGRVRIELGTDIAGGLAMVDAARRTIATEPEGSQVLQQLDAWLAKHASRRPQMPVSHR
jgi:tetratricopeptide (TPR) repeat protein